MKDSTYKVILIVVGLIFMFVMLMEGVDLVLAGQNDFAPFYVGTKLVGSGDLYKAEPYYAFLMERFEGTNDSLRYTRLPHHAVLFWPLGLLSYETSYAVWVGLRVAAIVGFLLLWRMPSRWDTVMFTALSFPLFTALFNGQDVPFLLLWIALAVHWHGKKKPFAAGLILALCAAKFHLFILLPVLFIGQRRWRMFSGFAAGGAFLTLVSFLAAGVRWPIEYIATLTDGRVHPSPHKMPNLHGLFSGLDFGLGLELVFGAAVVAGAWYVVRHASFHYGLAAALCGSLLLSYHAYLADCALLLPAVLMVCSLTSNRNLRVLGAVLLTPGFYLCLQTPPPASFFVPATILLFLGLMVLETSRRRSEATQAAGPAEPAYSSGRPLLADG